MSLQEPETKFTYCSAINLMGSAKTAHYLPTPRLAENARHILENCQSFTFNIGAVMQKPRVDAF